MTTVHGSADSPDQDGPRRLSRLVRRTAVTVAALAALLLVPVLAAAPASAHDVLVSTSPKAGQTLAQAPDHVELTFDQPALALGTTMVVQGPDGQVQQGKPELIDTRVRQALSPDLPAGPYKVTYRVTSADGHPISGTLAFTVTASSSAPATTPSDTGTSTAPATSQGEPSVAPTPPAPTAETSAAVPTSDDGTGSGWLLWSAVALIVLAGVGAGLLTVARRRRGGTG